MIIQPIVLLWCDLITKCAKYILKQITKYDKHVFIFFYFVPLFLMIKFSKQMKILEQISLHKVEFHKQYNL